MLKVFIHLVNSHGRHGFKKKPTSAGYLTFLTGLVRSKKRLDFSGAVKCILLISALNLYRL